MARRTREQIEQEVAERSAARREEYFRQQAESRAAAEAIAPELPAADAFRYNYAWRQDVGAPTGELALIRTPNPFYDPATNTIFDPATGERTPVTPSTFTGPSRIRGTGTPATGTTTRPRVTPGAGGMPTTGGVTPTGATTGGGSLTGAGASMALTNQQAAQEEFETRRQVGQSAFNLLFEQFNQYGLGGLVEPLRSLIVDGLSPAEFTLRLRETDAYRKRFAANQQRIAKGLRALSEAEYIGLEDQYQNIMRNYGLPSSYYTRGDMGRQEGFERFIAGDVSAAELEDRIQTAQNRVINAAPEVSRALREFYPGISNGDILAYALDPEKAITDIRRKVTAAEIGAGAMQAGLATGVARAEELARFGVTGEQARAGFQAVAEVLPRGSQLAEIYKQSPYTQATAEQEVFGLTGATEAARRRRQLTQLETAAFSGQAGAATGALARDRAGAI